MNNVVGNDSADGEKLYQDNKLLPPVQKKISELPFNDLDWADFERLLLRILQDVEGLRDVKHYGEAGQAQSGIDIVASDIDGSKVALQSKRYKKFNNADIKGIVNKFCSTERDFTVERLIIAVACSVRDTKVIDEFFRLADELKPIALELWDAQELSKLLREQPGIVIEFFGEEWANKFCYPYEFDIKLAPPVDISKFSDAIGQTPEVATNARLAFEKAKNAVTPDDALTHIEKGQALLEQAGFGPYAAIYEKERLELLVKLGRSSEAVEHLLEQFWTALDRGLLESAHAVSLQANDLGWREDQGSWPVCMSQMDKALILYQGPWNSLPDVESLRVNGDERDLRLVVLASEIALANEDSKWLKAALPGMLQLLEECSDRDELSIRLRLVVAEHSDSWDDLLVAARKSRLSSRISGLIQARYARYCAMRQKFQEADSEWEDSIRSATLAQCWYEASAWVFGRRVSRSYWHGHEGDLMPLQRTMLVKAATASPMFPISLKAYEKAIEEYENKKYRRAAILAHRALRDAVVIGDFGEEQRVRLLLAKILAELNAQEYYQMSARHYVRAGAIHELERFGKNVGDVFVDISQDLAATNYWTIGSAYRLLAVQADLIPDSYINSVVDCVVRDLDFVENESLVDLPGFNFSRFGNAIKCLAEIAHRIEKTHAVKFVRYFTSQVILDKGSYRFHDADESVALAKIALRFEELADEIIPYLIQLLKRSDLSRKPVTYNAIIEHSKIAYNPLRELAESGDVWANEMLVQIDMQIASLDVADAALKRLKTPLEHKPGTYTKGTRAIEDALLVENFPSEDIDDIVSELISRARDQKVDYNDRSHYLLAVVNLSDKVSKQHRKEFYDAAIQLIKNPTLSELDLLEQQFRSPLGFVRIQEVVRSDQGAAALVAAKFADSDRQKLEVKQLIYSLFIQGQDKWLAKALHSIKDMVLEDLGFLMGRNWEVRSLVAYLWADHNQPKYIGDLLAADPDFRVRISLADAIRDKPREQFPEIFEKLERDPRFSVRNKLKQRA